MREAGRQGSGGGCGSGGSYDRSGLAQRHSEVTK